ncbi:hypothetical protein ACT54M_13310, partial [Leptospira santarosai]|uniref:hypothetical protein n=1 Tax=Leptospira santarosai TaxID=28183 RepID=UPI0040356F8F
MKNAFCRDDRSFGLRLLFYKNKKFVRMKSSIILQRVPKPNFTWPERSAEGTQRNALNLESRPLGMAF